MGAKLERLDQLLRQTPAQAKAETAKHLDGELTVRPLPSTGRERRAEIRGRAKLNSLLEGQEAVCAEVVAGAGFTECYTAPATYWIDLCGGDLRPATRVRRGLDETRRVRGRILGERSNGLGIRALATTATAAETCRAIAMPPEGA